MKRILVAAGLAALLTAPLSADVTIKAMNSGKVMGMGGDMQTTTYVKGMKMRVDSVSGDTTRTSLFDVENQ